MPLVGLNQYFDIFLFGTQSEKLFIWSARLGSHLDALVRSSSESLLLVVSA